MNYKTDPNECAYPYVPSEWSNGDMGMTKREYFAALAMQSLVRMIPSSPSPSDEEAVWIADRAVLCADALIAGLNKDVGNGSQKIG